MSINKMSYEEVRARSYQAVFSEMMKKTKPNNSMWPPANADMITIYSPGIYKKEAVAFLKQYPDEDVIEKLCQNDNFYRSPVVGAKIFLCAEDWNKYVWIEQHGTLDGFS